MHIDPLLCKQIKAFICQSPVTDSWLLGVTGKSNWNHANRFPSALCYKEPHVLFTGPHTELKSRMLGGNWSCRGLLCGFCTLSLLYLSSFLKAVCVGKNQWFSETLRAHLDRNEQVRKGTPHREAHYTRIIPPFCWPVHWERERALCKLGIFFPVFPLGKEDTSGYRSHTVISVFKLLITTLTITHISGWVL